MPRSVESEPVVREADSVEDLNENIGEVEQNYISVNSAYRMIDSVFDGTDRRQLPIFCADVDAAFRLLPRAKHAIFYQYVLSRIKGEARKKLMIRRDIEDWPTAKAALKEYYSERRTIDYFIGELADARQGKDESVQDWASRIENLFTAFRDVAISLATPEEVPGIRKIAEQMGRSYFIKGLNNPIIKANVRGTHARDFAQAVEYTMEENAAWQADRGSTPLECRNCGKRGHTATRCQFRRDSYRDSKKRSPDNRTRGTVRAMSAAESVECFKCRRKGHFARDCKSKTACNKCGRMGHIAKDCRSKKENMSRGTNQRSSASVNVLRNTITCYYCGNRGHIKRECYKYLRDYDNGRQRPRNRETNYSSHRDDRRKNNKGSTTPVRDNYQTQKQGNRFTRRANVNNKPRYVCNEELN